MDDTDIDEEQDGPHAEDFNVGGIGDENDTNDDDHVAGPDEGGDAYIDPIMNFSQQINMDAARDHDMLNTTTNVTHEFYVG